MPSSPNLFVRLHKWAAKKRQEENFLTESLAVVLEQLLISAPEAGVRLVSRLTGEFINLAPNDANSIVVKAQPQVEEEKKKPDLELRIPHRLVWIEVKVRSPLQNGQLKNYRDLLNKSGIEQTRLALLALDHRVVVQAKKECPEALIIRWFELADWLENELPTINEASVIAGFIARQYLDLLREKNMALAKVDWQLPEGVRALSNLLNMLFMAAEACKLSIKKKANWVFSGMDLDEKSYCIGIFYDNPEKLWFHTRCRIDPEAAARLGEGELEDMGIPVGYRWWRGAELASESVHFFERSKVSQMRWLENFLRECLDMAHSIKTPDQPAIPEEPEES